MIGITNASSSVSKILLKVKCLVGDSITVTDGGSFSQTKTATATVTEFSLPSLTTYTVTSGTMSETIKANFYGIYEVDFGAYTYGISRSVSSSSVAWTRTDDSADFTAIASVGLNAGSSDFDDCPIYKDIKRVIMATGDVMVKIPKFYFKRYREDGTEYIKISNRPQSGFSLHPAFSHNGETQDCIYVGAYKTTSGHYSKSALAPLVNITRAAFRTNAANKGDGWSIIDISTLSSIEMLIMVEFATNDVQTAIGAGYSLSSHTAAINTGSCDSIPNLTGRPNGSTDNVDVVWRGIEGFWGNVWEWFDGFNFNNGTYYICNDQSKYADDTATNYTALSYTGATNWSSSYITEMGMDDDNPAIMLPKTATSGSATTYYADGVWSSTGWRVALRGGDWPNGTLVGLFALTVDVVSPNANTAIGSRLLYIP